MEKRNQKKFLKKPNYPGGSEAFKKFISENLRYPPEALAAGIQGSVLAGYDILDTGEVENIRIIKGIGYGCDEETERLISLLRFEKVKNRGLRLKVSTKTTIHFHIPGVVISYNSGSTPVQNSSSPEPDKSGPTVSYDYTISI